METFNEEFCKIGRSKVFLESINKFTTPFSFTKMDGTKNIEPFERWCARAITSVPDWMSYNEFANEYMQELLALYKSKGGQVYEI